MFSKLWAIARYTLLDYLRGRLWVGALIVALCVLVFEQLLSGLAITETSATRASLGGALLRQGLVLLLAAGVIVSHVREAGDRTLDWLLAFALPRAAWLGGRLLGHALAAMLLALFALPLTLLVAPVAAAGPWILGLACELVVCACMASFLALSLRQAPLALAAFLAWYLLARSMAALQLMAGAALLDDGGAWIGFCREALDALGFLLPRLDLFAPSVWLEGGAHWQALQVPALQALAYAVLTSAAAMVDLQRSEW